MSCVIFGAGKIARGFLGHLLYLSGIEFTFVEKVDALAQLINQRGEYLVNVLGAPEKNTVVKGAKALTFAQRDQIAAAISEADCVFDAVGGKNLGEIVPYLIAGIEKRAAENPRPLNIITCENWKKPADILLEGIQAGIRPEYREFLDSSVGITEAVIMRSAIEATPELLEKLKNKGVNIGFVTLHVGLGTFRPVKEETIADHEMHSEFIMVDAETAELINSRRAAGGRTIAVGTTSCRVLESVSSDDGKVQPYAGDTGIFIYPGYHFKAVDALITNFHLPERTLIMLVSAFASRERMLTAH